MLKRIKNFFQTTLLGGIAVILPISIVAFIFKWLFGIISNAINPLTFQFIHDNGLGPNKYEVLLAKAIVVVIILVACFFVGLLIKTRFGLFIFSRFEAAVLSKAPGYKMVKETIHQLFNQKTSPFSSVALIQIFQNETLVTGFITDEHDDGSVSVFVPTGPNPTSGFIYHLPKKYVHKVDVKVEEAMRSVISCGAGSSKLVKQKPTDYYSN